MIIKRKLIYAAVFFCVIYLGLISTSEAYCSLEKMKTFAVEACEHLFPNDETSSVRQKREYRHKHKSHDVSFGKKRRVYAIRRSSYPRGGYLKVAQQHFERLSQLNIFPMYKYHADKKQGFADRQKRETFSTYVGLPYCCYNKCDEDFFCR